jgi:hypothetical protein
MNDSVIIARVQARDKARACMALVLDESRDVGVEVDVFWEEIRKHLPLTQLKEEKRLVGPKPMDDVESRQFGNQIMEFGKYKGTRIDDVPMDWLEWYSDQGFQSKLKSYLASDRVRIERSNNEQGETE